MDYWDIVAELYNTTLSFSFIILGFLMFYIATKGLRAKNHYGAISTTVCGVCFIIFGYYNSVALFFPFPYNGYMVWWIGVVLILNILFAIISKRFIKGMANDLGLEEEQGTSHLRRYIIRMTQHDPYEEEISIRMEVIRKSFHLSGFLIWVAFYGFLFIPPITQIINDSIIVMINQIGPAYTILWGPISMYPYPVGAPQAIAGLTMMALIGSLVFAIISDIFRILWGPEYSVFNFITHSMLRDKERNAAGPHIYIMVGFILSFMLYMMELLDISAYFAGILIACLSDAAAALIGRIFGKHKVKVRSKETKSIEGFIAGVVVAYVIGLIIVGPIYAIIGATIFLITDYYPKYTADNILNPILIPIGIQFFIVILQLPVGW
ncbi:MAG: phosphatidate cytidylyltransferase [Candidatus Lokiarchaeota archaeon]|nr:phosphatidate cytidylyltransferase [Candidatus Lokiarchaeota archaeon]